ncbi:MAG: serine hydrolase [bacterium]
MKTYVTLIFLYFILTSNVYGQTTNIVESEGIKNPLHQANIGKITFMSELIPIDEYKESDFLQEFVFNEKSNLFIRTFMDNSLTNYLHTLKPELTVEQLTQNGNFQFSFYVDSKLIYTANVSPGAFGTENKNAKTVFDLPLQSVEEVDSWGWYMWLRFMMNGGEDALTAGEHLLKIELRPYLKTPELIAGDLIAQGQIKLNVVKPLVDPLKIEIQEIKFNSDWEVSTDNYDKEKIKELNLKIAENYFKKITSIVVIKDGKLLIEEYFNGAGQDTLHNTRSVGKSFASTLMGIAINDGFIKNENQTLDEFYDLKTFENYSAKKDSVTIKSLLTMSSAFAADDNDDQSPGNENNMYDRENWVRWALNLPMTSDRNIGEKWVYFTGGAVVLGDIINKSVPGGLEKYAEEKLFKPLAIDRYQWGYTPQHVPNTAGGLTLTSLGLAKFGQLYKNQGMWKGKQVIPKEWVIQSFQPYQQTDYGDKYGYLFWNKIYKVDGKQFETFYCGGNGGNKIFIFKDVPLVIIVTATAYNKPYMHQQVDKMMEKYILPAVIK